MINTRIEYNKRLREVELYFDTLKLLDKGHCTINCVDILGNLESKSIDTDLSTILKANGFILLYNLVEATIRNSIDAVLNSIHSSTVTFRELSEKLRKIWLKQELKGLNPDKNTKEILLMTNTILENEILKFERDCINISGNIDAKRIREIIKQFGGNEISNGRNLKIIKEKRNNLAHGEFTFAEVGKDYSIQDLINYKNETQNYLSRVLDEVQDYINNQKYLNH
jgi:hypothetical protein